MVKYQSDGVFDASIERIWRLLTEEHSPDNITDVHRSIQGTRILEQKDNVVVQEMTTEGPDGQPMPVQVRFTMDPPGGFKMEWLTGPLAGSECDHTYTPLEEGTRVEVVGDFVGKGMSDEQVLAVVDEMMNASFEEDNAFMQANP